MSSYLKAMQLTKQLEEKAKEEKRLRIKAEERIAEIREIRETGEVNARAIGYQETAEEHYSQKAYTSSIINSSLALISQVYPKKSKSIVEIYAEIGHLNLPDYDNQVIYSLMNKVDEYYSSALLKFWKKADKKETRVKLNPSTDEEIAANQQKTELEKTIILRKIKKL